MLLAGGHVIRVAKAASEKKRRRVEYGGSGEGAVGGVKLCDEVGWRRCRGGCVACGVFLWLFRGGETRGARDTRARASRWLPGSVEGSGGGGRA